MSLNYNLTKIENYEDTCWQDTGEKYKDTGEPIFRIHPVLETIIFSSMIVGLNSLTVKNIDEWVFRIEMLALAGLDIPYRVWKGEEMHEKHLDHEDLAPFVGLTVNVSSEKRPTWNRTLIKRMEQKVKDRRWVKARAIEKGKEWEAERQAEVQQHARDVVDGKIPAGRVDRAPNR